ncbi:MAG: biopolymer transporter ExbD [Acidobacteriia bacterium]|nr:biopolymer transporter ExbD [Terriglobia bacterium]
MSMAVGGPGGGPKSDINMTPMIDVLLVLIIIFMVITPLTPKGLEALVPQPPPPNQKQTLSDQRTVVIVIDKDHNMMINSEPTDENKLGQRLDEIFKTRAERVVFVKGDPSLDFMWVAKAIDIAHGAQIDKVGLMTAKVEAGQ